MRISRNIISVSLLLFVLFAGCLASAAEQPVAIFHAFDQRFSEVEAFVCTLAEQGYSHVQIAPAQKSNPLPDWWARYQPVDYSVIEGRGSEQDLKNLVSKAHGCGVKVIADVVFNHMADMEQYRGLNFPGLSPGDFHKRCEINYQDGNRNTEVNCWLGSLPDLDQSSPAVRKVQLAHLKKLLNIGIDGFRFDAAKHLPEWVVKEYVAYIDRESNGNAWNYLEVISDGDTRPTDYNWIAPVEDFILYRSARKAFTYGGDLRSLRTPETAGAPRSVTFGRNHDNIRQINRDAIEPYDDWTDSYLATAYVLAREDGVPLVLNWDNADAPYIRTGVQFRKIMRNGAVEGANVRETVCTEIDSQTVLMMARGTEGFFIVNKGTDRFDIPVLDLTNTNLEGCYRELRNDFTVAVERRENGRKYITRWGSWNGEAWKSMGETPCTLSARPGKHAGNQ